MFHYDTKENWINTIIRSIFFQLPHDQKNLNTAGQLPRITEPEESFISQLISDVSKDIVSFSRSFFNIWRTNNIFIQAPKENSNPNNQLRLYNSYKSGYFKVTIVISRKNFGTASDKQSSNISYFTRFWGFEERVSLLSTYKEWFESEGEKLRDVGLISVAARPRRQGRHCRRGNLSQ